MLGEIMLGFLTRFIIQTHSGKLEYTVSSSCCSSIPDGSLDFRPLKWHLHTKSHVVLSHAAAKEKHIDVFEVNWNSLFLRDFCSKVYWFSLFYELWVRNEGNWLILNHIEKPSGTMWDNAPISSSCIHFQQSSYNADTAAGLAALWLSCG